MARPGTHGAVVSGLVVSVYFLKTAFNLADALWIVLFGVFIDADKMPYGRLWQAFRKGGRKGALESWKKEGWLDPSHLNFFHTWWALVGGIIFSYLVGNYWPAVSYSLHMGIDGASRSQMDYPQCSPLPAAIHRFFPRWMTYYTGGIPVPPGSREGK